MIWQKHSLSIDHAYLLEHRYKHCAMYTIHCPFLPYRSQTGIAEAKSQNLRCEDSTTKPSGVPPYSLLTCTLSTSAAKALG